MQILLVDDDRFVLYALESKIDWPSLQVSQVFTAANMEQAQKIIQSEHIDLLISDIEMPQGSGLELLAWLRSEGSQIQTIFLTNYADFNYAQKAIELQSFEYYLKPIDYEKLTLIIKKALEKIITQKKTAYNDSSEKNQIIENVFWERALSHPLAGKMSELLTMDEFKDLSFNRNMNYAVATITLFPYHLNWDPFKITMDSDLTRTLQLATDNLKKDFEMFGNITAFRRKNQLDSFALIISITNECDTGHTLVAKFLQQLNKKLMNEIGWQSIALTEKPTPFEEIETTTLNLFNEVDIFVRYRSYRVSHQAFWQQPVRAKPITAEFEKLLASQDWRACVSFLKEVIQDNAENQQIPSDYLKALKLDLTQSLHSFLNEKEILAHQLLHNKEHQFLSERSFNSIESFVDYFQYCIKTSLTFIEWSHSQKSVATIVKEYIDEHYAQEINRSTIADFVFLSPDHVARIFKKEMNISLGAYIIERRLEIAKHLLTTTILPINVIATKVGYDNYSYFTKLFKKHTQYTPQEFRHLFTT